MVVRFPLPTELSREDLESPAAAVARQVRLESAVERVLGGVLRDFLADVLSMVDREGSAITVGQLWMSWSAIAGSALADLPPDAGAWLLQPIAFETDIPDVAYDSIQAVYAAALTERWSASTTRDQLRLALQPDVGPSSLVAAGRRGPRHGARWEELDTGGMSFMDRMKRDARTAVTGLDGILTSSALRDQGFTRKRWVTRHDAKVRETHREVEGDTVPLEQPFYVGGYPLMYPGERGAPLSLVINCRCVMVGTRWRARGSFPQGVGVTP